MSLETTAVFSMDEVRYGDETEVRFFEARTDRDGSRRKTDRIQTSLLVSHNPGSHIGEYHWEHRELWFNTNNTRQFLEIEIVSPQIWQSERRFHLHRLHTNSLHRVRAIEHKRKPEHPWAALNNTTDEFPEHTRFIRLSLSLPGEGQPTSFKLCVFSRDRELRRDINCDPLVGNDPPRTGGG